MVDVSGAEQIDAANEEIAEDLGGVDIVVANAGIGGSRHRAADYSDASWHKVIGVNLDGVFSTQRAGIRRCA